MSLVSKTAAAVGGNSFRQKAETGFHGDHPGFGCQGNPCMKLQSYLFMST
jgi:hypothetical protein